MPKRFFDRFKRLDDLIRTKSTGTPAKLAERLEVSESSVYEYLAIMKSLGAPIKYDKDRCTYYYEEDGQFKIYFEKK